MHIQQKSLRKILGWLTLATTLLILCLGLWPYSVDSVAGIHWVKTSAGSRRLVFFPPNEVQWLKNGPGLHFGDYGSIFSAGDFTAQAQNTSGCSFEVWLEPTVTEDFTTTLAFSTKESPLQFRLRQLEDSLSVSRNWLNEKRHVHTDKIWVDHVFQAHQPLLITLSSGDGGTAVYLNGKLRQNYPGFRLRASDFTGRFVFGNSPLGHETWGGELRGLAIYPSELSADVASQHYQIWSTGAQFPANTAPSPTALYRFKEGSGAVTKSEVAGAPDLTIPESFQTLRPILLQPFWEEYEGNWDYWVDIVLNVAAFVPFGFLLCGYLKKGIGATHPMRKTMAAGFLLSLTIELGQYFLPMRNSGTMDLITNSTGALVGAILFATGPVRRAVRHLLHQPGHKGNQPPEVVEVSSPE